MTNTRIYLIFECFGHSIEYDGPTFCYQKRQYGSHNQICAGPRVFWLPQMVYLDFQKELCQFLAYNNRLYLCAARGISCVSLVESPKLLYGIASEQQDLEKQGEVV